jgi:hypothetical protein
MEGRSPIPASVGVLYGPDTAGKVAVQVTEGPEGQTRYEVPVGDALVEGYTVLLPRVFQRVERVSGRSLPTDSPLDGTLEITLENAQVAFPAPSETRPCRVGVVVSFTLRDRAGAVVATWNATGSGQVPRGATVDCGGEATASALHVAEVGMLRGLEDRREVRAWIAGMGRSWEPPGEPTEARRTLARSSDESVLEEPDPRLFGVYGGVGYFIPQTTSGAPAPEGGLSLLLGGAWRPLRWFGVALEAHNLSSSIASADLNQTLLCVLARFTWPIAIVEPWVAGGMFLDFVYASQFTTSPGGFATKSTASQFAPGGIVAGGLDVVVTRNVEVGARWQWAFARADLSALPGSSTLNSVNAGGQSVLVTGGYFWP